MLQILYALTGVAAFMALIGALIFIRRRAERRWGWAWSLAVVSATVVALTAINAGCWESWGVPHYQHGFLRDWGIGILFFVAVGALLGPEGDA